MQSCAGFLCAQSLCFMPFDFSLTIPWITFLSPPYRHGSNLRACLPWFCYFLFWLVIFSSYRQTSFSLISFSYSGKNMSVALRGRCKRRMRRQQRWPSRAADRDNNVRGQSRSCIGGISCSDTQEVGTPPRNSHVFHLCTSPDVSDFYVFVLVNWWGSLSPIPRVWFAISLCLHVNDRFICTS